MGERFWLLALGSFVVLFVFSCVGFALCLLGIWQLDKADVNMGRTRSGRKLGTVYIAGLVVILRTARGCSEVAFRARSARDRDG